MRGLLKRLDWNRAIGLLVVLALHGAVLYGLWAVRVIPHPAETVTLFVNLINPPPPQSRPQAIPPPKPPTRQIKQEAARPVEPPHRHLAAEAPVTSPTDAVEPLPPADPVVAAPPSEPSMPMPSSPPQAEGPVSLESELALVCSKRTRPTYPSVARRLGETGKVVLRVEIDAAGRVSAAEVVSSSGFDRLDTAALAAVKSWRCQPAFRDGQAVRSVALQPFNFTLEER